MKKISALIVVIIIVAIFLPSTSFAWGKREQGILIGVLAAPLVGPVVGEVLQGTGRLVSGTYGHRSPAYGGYGYGGNEYDRSYQAEIERLRQQEFYRQQQLLRERGTNDARRDFYGYR